MSASSSSQCPPSCSHRPNRGCRVSSACVPVWSSTSAEAVTWPGTHSRRQPSARASTKRQHRVPQRVLRGIGCVPTRSAPRWPNSRSAHLRTSRPSVVPGRAGPTARRDSRSRWRPTVPSRRAAPARTRTRSAAKIVEPIQQLPTPRTASATSSACTAAPTATVNMVCSAAVRAASGIAVRTVGHHERDDQFGCVVEDLAAADPAFDGVAAPCRRRPRSARHWSFIRSSSAVAWPSRLPSRRTAPAGCGAARARSALRQRRPR